MTIDISEKNERLLKAAVASGKFPSEEEALSESLRLMLQTLALATHAQGTNGHDSTDSEEVLPPDEWIKEFDQLTASREVSVIGMEDSRESIYGDHDS